MYTARNRFIYRFLCICITIALLLGCVPIAGDTVEVLTLEDSCSASAAFKIPSVTKIHKSGSDNADAKISCNSKSTVPYITDVLLEEMSAIVTYANGENPTAKKAIGDKGQNTKSNVALTVIFLLKNAKAVRSLRFELLPYGNQENIYELCVFYTPVFGKQEQCYRTGVLHDYNTETIYTVDGTGILGIGYDFNFDFDTFSSAADPWQRDFGFCRDYDRLAFLIGDWFSTIRVRFRYNDRDWMIQLWKGTYSFNMQGAEIGIYNKPTDREALYYDCAADPDRMEMSFTVCLDGEELVSAPAELKWWQTKFTYHPFVHPDRLELTATIKFPNRDMMNAFAESLTEADSSVSYTTNGTTLTLLWPASK